MMNTKKIDTHNKFITFGKYRGERWTRLPVHYLKFLANGSQGISREMAEAELQRRGTTTLGELELSGHAIDRASQITDEWKEIGVHSWLAKITNEALELFVDSDRIEYKGYIFIFTFGNHFPVLKTIMVNKKTERAVEIE